MSGDDWSPLLSVARAHLVDWDRNDVTAAGGWMAALLTPHVEAAFDADSPDVLDVAVDAVLAAELPAALVAFAPVIRTALLAGAAALWRSLQGRAIRVEADGSELTVEVQA